jgi:hypothetical protein
MDPNHPLSMTPLLKLTQPDSVGISNAHLRRYALIEAPETPHIHHGESAPHKRHWMDWAMPLAVVALSLGSLYVSIHTGKTMESLVAQNERIVRANSTPILQFGFGNAGDVALSRELKMELKNVGTGPARIVWLELSADGKKFTSIMDIAMRASRLPNAKAELENYKNKTIAMRFTTSSASQSILAANDTVNLMTWPYPSASNVEQSIIWDAADTLRPKIKATACYCSLFDECWESQMQGDIPKPVKACRPAGPNAV